VKKQAAKQLNVFSCQNVLYLQFKYIRVKAWFNRKDHKGLRKGNEDIWMPSFPLRIMNLLFARVYILCALCGFLVKLSGGKC